MEQEHGNFAEKILELEEEYRRLHNQLELFQRKDAAQIHQAREQLREEYHRYDRFLDQTVQACRCPTMARLAELQRDYERQAEQLLSTHTLAGDMGSQSQAETMTLYAEFAMDAATQSMRYALVCALHAMELQIQADRNTSQGKDDRHE